LIASGLAVLLESRLPQNAVVLTTLAMSSHAGLSVALLPWLLTGGTLVLHYPFDTSVFLAQRRSVNPDAVVLPGPLIAPLGDAGCLPAGFGSLLAVWRAPDRLARAPAWRDQATPVIDIQVFGEIGLIPARRGAGGRPAIVPFGVVALPRGAKGAVIVAEVRPTANGTVAMRGPMVPRCPFPPGVERTPLPRLRVAANGFVDTGYACWNEHDNAPLVVTGPPPGMISVGGYRFAMRDLQDTIGAIDAAATLAALPDAFAGHRLAGAAPDRIAVQQRLETRGVNPLLYGAFHPRKPAAEDRDAGR
jgi:hypothetical protein